VRKRKRINKWSALEDDFRTSVESNLNRDARSACASVAVAGTNTLLVSAANVKMFGVRYRADAYKSP
jgi:hypothetical protein